MMVLRFKTVLFLEVLIVSLHIEKTKFVISAYYTNHKHLGGNLAVIDRFKDS